MAEVYITNVWVRGFMKKDKHYVYIIDIIRSDAMKFQVYRRYADFFSFQSTLLQRFPVEAGKANFSERVIPTLPTVDNLLKLLGRTNSKRVMQSRLKTINQYCQTLLLKLDCRISRSNFVLDFFLPVAGDKQLPQLARPISLHPQQIPAGSQFEEHIVLADYEAEWQHCNKCKQLSVKAGESVAVLNKDDTGWWLVTRETDKQVGWLPGSFLKKVDDLELVMDDCCLEFSSDEESTWSYWSDGEYLDDSSAFVYITIADYSSDDPTQVSFPEGARVIVIDQDEDGWWFISYEGVEGWAPSSFLEPADSSVGPDLDEVQTVDDKDADDEKSEEETKKIYYARVDYMADLEDEITFSKGAALEVLKKSALGWWTVRYNGKVGLAPATFLSEDPPDTYVSASGEQVHVKRRASKMIRPPPRRKTVNRSSTRKEASKRSGTGSPPSPQKRLPIETSPPRSLPNTSPRASLQSSPTHHLQRASPVLPQSLRMSLSPSHSLQALPIASPVLPRSPKHSLSVSLSPRASPVLLRSAKRSLQASHSLPRASPVLLRYAKRSLQVSHSLSPRVASPVLPRSPKHSLQVSHRPLEEYLGYPGEEAAVERVPVFPTAAALQSDHFYDHDLYRSNSLESFLNISRPTHRLNRMNAVRRKASREGEIGHSQDQGCSVDVGCLSHSNDSPVHVRCPEQSRADTLPSKFHRQKM